MRTQLSILILSLCCGPLLLPGCGALDVANLDPDNFSGLSQQGSTCEGVSDSFVNDVLPVFSSQGCDTQACHGSAASGGMSLIGSNQAIFDNATGSGRVNTSNAPSSTLLRKPVGAVSHGGGSIFSSVSDPNYVTILCWIEEGATFDDLVDDTVPNDDSTEVLPTLSSIQANIFTPSCTQSSCHNSSSEARNLDLSDGNAFDELVGVVADSPQANMNGTLRVVPGDADESFLIQKLEGPDSAVEGAVMPLTGSISQSEIDVIREWIDNGAQDN